MIRKAVLDDVPQIHALLQFYNKKVNCLPGRFMSFTII